MPKIMIVDDDRTTVGLLQTLLELDGFDVVLAPDGKTALQIAKSESPDAFLVDFNLSDIEGTEFIRELRAEAEFAHSPVIMASGMERGDVALGAGADYFMIKPFDPGDLVDKFNQLLGI
nr:response regulator [Anaerolineae bacterium]